MENILVQNVTYQFRNSSVNITLESKKSFKLYDYRGAMLFTVATVCVYGLSIVAFIAGHINRREHTKEEESQIHKYLKHTEQMRQEGIRDDVLRLRSQLLADSVMSHYGVCEKTRRQSRVYQAHLFLDHCTPGTDNDSDNDTVCPSDSVSEPQPRRVRKIGLAILAEKMPFMDDNGVTSETVCGNTGQCDRVTETYDSGEMASDGNEKIDDTDERMDRTDDKTKIEFGSKRKRSNDLHVTFFNIQEEESDKISIIFEEPNELNENYLPTEIESNEQIQ